MFLKFDKFESYFFNFYYFRGQKVDNHQKILSNFKLKQNEVLCRPLRACRVGLCGGVNLNFFFFGFFIFAHHNVLKFKSFLIKFSISFLPPQVHGPAMQRDGRRRRRVHRLDAGQCVGYGGVSLGLVFEWSFFLSIIISLVVLYV